MTIYLTSSKAGFLSETADIAIKNYAADFSKVKIISQSGLTCTALQQIFVGKLGACILPTIISLNEIAAENEEIFKIPSEQIGCISRLEEKITLAETIYEYRELKYDQTRCLRLSSSLAGIFFELEANDIDIQDLKNLPTLDRPEHWHKIYDFLFFAYKAWNDKILGLKKITRAKYQKLLLESELNLLRSDPSKTLIIAGIYSDQLMIKNFIANALKHDNGHYIIPPHPYTPRSPEKYKNSYLQNIVKFLEPLKIDIPVGSGYKKSVMDNLIIHSEAKNLDQEISYIEFDNLFHEAEYIALKCRDLLAQNPYFQVAIIAHNRQIKEQCSIFLSKYSVTHRDQFGRDILQSQAISLLIRIAEQLYRKFNLKSFFSFLSHPLIKCELTDRLKMLIRTKNRFADDKEKILDILNKHADQGLIEYFLFITSRTTIKNTSNKFTSLCENIFLVAEILVPNIWLRFQEIISPLKELSQLKNNFTIEDLEEFPEILVQILSGGRLFDNSNLNSRVVITDTRNIALINYDLVIIADLNDAQYPNIDKTDSWVNNDMKKKLKLKDNRTKLDEMLYEFYLVVQNKNIILSRSRRDISNKKTLPSPFILNLKYILGDYLNPKIGKIDLGKILEPLEKKNISTPSPIIKSSDFPAELYATDIELLIRSPFNFYAKKILKLKKIEEIDEHPNLADFGNFFHKVMEKYTEQYQPFIYNKHEYICNIAANLLKNSTVPNRAKKDWEIKIKTMADELIIFDESRRKNLINIYTEIKGTTEIKIKDRIILLSAIADRIEVNNKGIVSILDFKTGAIPIKKDILSGLSPQMLVESIVFDEKGFGIAGRLEKIIYVKINSSEPYITTTEIGITTDEIKRHKEGLIKLLEYYIQNPYFPTEPNAVKYDDYKHLAGRP